ncbi:MAG TPA: DUF1080 domain-containing protein [Gemmata sp.]|nr:DUF1080 domain-containing protein [Gemmata sp.]
MVTRIIPAILLLAAIVPASADEPRPEEKWIPLFNGKDLDGWTPKIKGYELGVNHADTFRVEDGAIKVRYDKYKEFDGKFGHLFYKDKFSHYRLRVEYRFVGDQCKGGPGWATRNSGVMFHCQDPKTMRKDQDFPVSVEFQLLGGLGKGKRPTANMCSPGTNIVLNGKLFTTHCFNSKSKTYDGDVWVTAELEVHGSGTVKHFVNGELVLEYEKPQLDPKDADAKKLIQDDKLLLEEGYISLQAESHPCDFRKVEVKVLRE